FEEAERLGHDVRGQPPAAAAAVAPQLRAERVQAAAAIGREPAIERGERHGAEVAGGPAHGSPRGGAQDLAPSPRREVRIEGLLDHGQAPEGDLLPAGGMAGHARRIADRLRLAPWKSACRRPPWERAGPLAGTRSPRAAPPRGGRRAGPRGPGRTPWRRAGRPRRTPGRRTRRGPDQNGARPRAETRRTARGVRSAVTTAEPGSLAVEGARAGRAGGVRHPATTDAAARERSAPRAPRRSRSGARRAPRARRTRTPPSASCSATRRRGARARGAC